MPNEDVESGWRLRFDRNEHDVVLPPSTLSVIVRGVEGGPNLQALEHCQYASMFEEMWYRAPVFHMNVPITKKGNRREWPTGDVGHHMKIKLPIAIFESRRVSDHTFQRLLGNVKFRDDSCWLFIREMDELEVEINNYSTEFRKGKISMPRELYLAIIEMWQRHFFETS